MDIAKRQAKHVSAAKALLELAESDRAELLAAMETAGLHEVERAKTHPLGAGKFSAAERAQMKEYVLDGGGVKDDQYLRQVVMQALMDDDWVTICREIPHVVKSWINLRAPVVEAREAGTVIIHGFGPTPKGLEE